jgi:hypothetical protein
MVGNWKCNIEFLKEFDSRGVMRRVYLSLKKLRAQILNSVLFYYIKINFR